MQFSNHEREHREGRPPHTSATQSTAVHVPAAAMMGPSSGYSLSPPSAMGSPLGYCYGGGPEGGEGPTSSAERSLSNARVRSVSSAGSATTTASSTAFMTVHYNNHAEDAVAGGRGALTTAGHYENEGGNGKQQKPSSSISDATEAQMGWIKHLLQNTTSTASNNNVAAARRRSASSSSKSATSRGRRAADDECDGDNRFQDEDDNKMASASSSASSSVSPATPSPSLSVAAQRPHHVDAIMGAMAAEEDNQQSDRATALVLEMMMRGTSVDTATTAGDWDDDDDDDEQQHDTEVADGGKSHHYLNSSSAAAFSPLTRAQERRRLREVAAAAHRRHNGESNNTDGADDVDGNATRNDTEPRNGLPKATACPAIATAVDEPPAAAAAAAAAAATLDTMMGGYGALDVVLSPPSTRYAYSQSVDRGASMALFASPPTPAAAPAVVPSTTSVTRDDNDDGDAEAPKEQSVASEFVAPSPVAAAPATASPALLPSSTALSPRQHSPMNVDAQQPHNNPLLFALLSTVFSDSESHARGRIAMEEERDRSAVLEVRFIKMSVGELGRLAAELLEENKKLRRDLKKSSKQKP